MHPTKKAVGNGTRVREAESPVKDVRQRERGSHGRDALQPAKIINVISVNSINDKKQKAREATESWMNTPISFPVITSEDISDEPLIIEAKVEGYFVRRVYVDEGSSVEVMFKHCFENLDEKTKARLKETQTDFVGFAGEISKPLKIIELEVCFGNGGLCRMTSMKFIVVRALSPYNVILVKPRLKTDDYGNPPREGLYPSREAFDKTRAKIRNEDLRTELEYFIEDYDEEREMEPRPEPLREATPTLPLRSHRVRRQRERVVGFKDAPNREGNRRRRNAEGIGPSETEGRGGSVTPFVRWIEDYPLSDGLKMPSHIGYYDRKGNPNNFLHLFEGAIHMKKWLMPVACHMFTDTLKDSARIWWNSQKTGSILNYEDLKAKFRKNSIVKKRHVDHDEIGEITFPPLPNVGSADPVIIKAYISGRKVPSSGLKHSSCRLSGEQSWPLGEIPLEITIEEGPTAIPIAKKDKEKATFFTREGVFCYKRLPLGLKNARDTYQRLIDKVFGHQMGRNMEVNADDMVIMSDFEDEMMANINETLERLRAINLKLNPDKCSFEVEEGRDVESNQKITTLSRFLSKSAERTLPFMKTLRSCTSENMVQWTKEADKAFRRMKECLESLPTMVLPTKGETLTMYLATSEEIVSAVLMAKRGKKQIPVYFVSRTLHGAELKYPELEKLILALVYAARRLRRYFQAHPIQVLNDKPINQILAKPGKSGRIAKWAIELGEHEIKFRGTNSIKGKILTDFLAETPLLKNKEAKDEEVKRKEP
uniref:Putative reverse transcriptase domain, ribonuclease H-like domain protein n=1 Tax=Tanacetum cinerariifolium TaxID=118510 RepID=A0A6L2P0T3_TANCI|nr:putative reverse transcriptase domain, ribonuclease H-like domain protein [Tanacetum cinerariifolium]